MSNINNSGSSPEKPVTSRRNFLSKGTKMGLQIAAGLFAFLPAANSLAKDIHLSPLYVPCQTRVCYFYSCEVPCSISNGGCYCYDARNQNTKCGCAVNNGSCINVNC